MICLSEYTAVIISRSRAAARASFLLSTTRWLRSPLARGWAAPPATLPRRSAAENNSAATRASLCALPALKSAGAVPAVPTSTAPDASLAAALPLQEENFLAESGSNAYTFILHSFVRSTHQLSHAKDRLGVWSCIPEVNLMQLPSDEYGLASPESHPLARNPESTTQRGRL